MQLIRKKIINNKKNKKKIIFKNTFLYSQYLSNSKIVIIESKQYFKHKIKNFFFDFLTKDIF